MACFSGLPSETPPLAAQIKETSAIVSASKNTRLAFVVILVGILNAIGQRLNSLLLRGIALDCLSYNQLKFGSHSVLHVTEAHLNYLPCPPPVFCTTMDLLPYLEPLEPSAIDGNKQ